MGGFSTTRAGLTSGNLYYVQSISVNEITLHLTREGADTNTNVIGLTAGSNETHGIYSAYAAVHNSTTADIVLAVSGGTSPSYRNSSTGTVTITNAVTLTITVNDTAGDPVDVASVAVYDYTGQVQGSEITAGSTNASGIYTDNTVNYSSDLDILIRVRLKGYIPFVSTGVIESTGFSLSVRFIADDIVV